MSARALIDALRREAALLQRGEFDALEAVQAEKEQAARAMGRRATQDELAMLRTLAQENERLFSVALTACKRAKSRLQAVENSQSVIGYTDEGNRLSSSDRKTLSGRRY